MAGAGSMSRLALMFGGGSTSTFTSGTNGGTLSTTDLSLATTAFNDLANQLGGLTVGGARHLLHQGRSEALRVALGRKAAPAAAGVVGVTRRQLLGSVLGSALMNPQVLCGTWDAVVACGFINFVLYAASAVMAFLEWRASKKAAPATQVQVAKPASAAQPAAQPAAQTAAPTAA
ncbi:hypothetical protein OEZ86_006751 [Tetradesmus obliquus]|nr:hypothetical protein OEZ86_006751 [Tetradesmus obliquus]